MRPGIAYATRADWLALYSVEKDGVPVTLGDDRTWAPSATNPELLFRADALIARGIAAADRVLVLGCGPGAFLVEALKARGRTNVWGADNSPWAASRGTVQAGGVILINADMTSGQSFNNAVRTATGATTFRWIVTESVLESYDDLDVNVILNACEGLRAAQTPLGNIIHIVYPAAALQGGAVPGLFNEKTMAAWKAMRATHTWMSAEGYGVA